MQKLKEALPFVLLVSFLALSHYKQPQIADSIIIIALSALSGYKFYLDSLKKPDYLKEFKAELDKRDKEVEDLKTIVGMYGVAQQNQQRQENINW